MRIGTIERVTRAANTEQKGEKQNSMVCIQQVDRRFLNLRLHIKWKKVVVSTWVMADACWHGRWLITRTILYAGRSHELQFLLISTPMLLSPKQRHSEKYCRGNSASLSIWFWRWRFPPRYLRKAAYAQIRKESEQSRGTCWIVPTYGYLAILCIVSGLSDADKGPMLGRNCSNGSTKSLYEIWVVWYKGRILMTPWENFLCAGTDEGREKSLLIYGKYATMQQHRPIFVPVLSKS